MLEPVKVLIKCEACDGHGTYVYENGLLQCSHCNGKGKKTGIKQLDSEKGLNGKD